MLIDPTFKPLEVKSRSTASELPSKRSPPEPPPLTVKPPGVDALTTTSISKSDAVPLWPNCAIKVETSKVLVVKLRSRAATKVKSSLLTLV